MKNPIRILFFSFILLITGCNSSQQKETMIVKKTDLVETCIAVEGMTCVGCEVTLEKNLTELNGVVKVSASSSKDEATITFDKSKTDEKTLIKAIETAGYRPILK
ncbi:MAG TPA: copper chaperone [Crocinitomicaceae bacterium]|nr:copper chaperone [Crocinitomicaceae bacterium]